MYLILLARIRTSYIDTTKNPFPLPIHVQPSLKPRQLLNKSKWVTRHPANRTPPSRWAVHCQCLSQPSFTRDGL